MNEVGDGKPLFSSQFIAGGSPTRRDFFKLMAIGAGGIVLEGCGPLVGPDNSLALSPISSSLEFPPNELLTLHPDEEFTLGDKIRWSPDGHMPYFTLDDGNRRYMVSGNQTTYIIDGKPDQSFYEAAQSSNRARPAEGLGPDESKKYRNGYSTINGILPVDSTSVNHLVAVAHNEQHGNSWANFTATVGLYESNDAGLHWQDKGVLIEGFDAAPPGGTVTGAGQPSIIKVGEYAYVYFIHWASGKTMNQPAQIYLARSPITNFAPNTLEFFTENGFKQKGTFKPNDLHPVIAPPTEENGDYAAFPGVSYNAHRQIFVTPIESNNGIHIATSKDGIEWSKPTTVIKFPKKQQGQPSGATWWSYPTLLSEKTSSSDRITTQKGFLYTSKGVRGGAPHHFARFPFELKV